MKFCPLKYFTRGKCLPIGNLKNVEANPEIDAWLIRTIFKVLNIKKWMHKNRIIQANMKRMQYGTF